MKNFLTSILEIDTYNWIVQNLAKPGKFTIFTRIKRYLMTTIDHIKNRLIDRILVSKNEKLLNAIDSIFNSTQSEEKITLNSYQIEMLMMSEIDIEQGNLISETDLEKSDAEWL